MHDSDVNPDIQDHYRTLRAAVQAACVRHGRDVAAVRLMAVSKTHPVAAVAAAYAAGARDFGENYVAEGCAKVLAFEALEPHAAVNWHFIGPLQSNKTRWVAEHFDWVHSVDRVKIAQRLHEQRPHSVAPLNVCVQVNVSGEASKSGVCLAGWDGLPHASHPLALRMQSLMDLSLAILEMPRLRLRGLMAIPAPIAAGQTQTDFARMQGLFAAVRAGLPATAQMDFDTLSMGMSDDFDAAIAAGSTMVRIGTAIFGQREAASNHNQ